MEKCWLRDGCPDRTAYCSSCQPTDDGCPVYRRFRCLFNKPEKPKDIHEDVKIGACPKCRYTLTFNMRFCPMCGQAIKWGKDENNMDV